MSRLASQFERLWALHKGPALTKEVTFFPGRRFRFDYAHHSAKAAIELDGGVFVRRKGGGIGGRHSGGMGQVRDFEKGRLAAYSGWNVIHFSVRCLTLENVRQAVEWFWTRIKERA
jgi:very-short-patch-repair endonuclease